MATNNNFKEIMQKRTNAELVEIVTKLRNDYQPDAVVAAELELEKRNLTLEVLKKTEIEIEQKEKETHQKQNEPLETHWKILCLFFPGIINIMLSFIFKGQGQDRKFKEAWMWTLYGLGMYITIPVLLSLLFNLFDL